MIELALIVAAIYAIHLIDKWLDERAADKFVKKMTGRPHRRE